VSEIEEINKKNLVAIGGHDNKVSVGAFGVLFAIIFTF
jgi:hypothetical protein